MFHILSCYYTVLQFIVVILKFGNGAYSLAKAFQSSLGWTENTWLTKTRHGDANDVKSIVPGWNCIDNACHHKHAGPKTCFYTSKLKTTYCIVQSVGRYEQIVKRRAVRRIVHFFQHCAIIVPCNWRKGIFHGLYTRTGVCSHDLLY